MTYRAKTLRRMGTTARTLAKEANRIELALRAMRRLIDSGDLDRLDMAEEAINHSTPAVEDTPWD